MILERGAISIGVAAVAAAGINDPQPAVWHLLGYPFPALGMIAALFACFCARFWSGEQLRQRKEFRWSLDIPVSLMTFAAAAAGVIELHPDPIAGLGLGAGVGVIGEGLFRMAKHYAERLGLFGSAADGQPD